MTICLFCGSLHRWINRGAYDLLDVNPEATASADGIPKAEALYGPLPKQLKDPDSFASRLKKLLEIRKNYGIALSEQISVPETKHNSVLIMLHRLPRNLGIEITALNFGRKTVKESLTIDEIKGLRAVNLLINEEERNVSLSGKFTLTLDSLEGKILLYQTK